MDAGARVYEQAGSVYGCASGIGGSHRLGSSGFTLRGPRIEMARVAGRIAAYGMSSPGVDTGYATVEVRRLSDGRLLARRPATTTAGVEGFESVDAIVVRSDGAVAWIATARSIGSPRFVRQLQALDRRGLRLLDAGRALVPTSLRLRGSTLSWRHGASIRTAPLA